MLRLLLVTSIFCFCACSSDDTSSVNRSVSGGDKDASSNDSHDKGGSTDAGSAKRASGTDAGEAGRASSDTKNGSSSSGEGQRDAGGKPRDDDADGGTQAPVTPTPTPTTTLNDDDAGTSDPLPDTESCCIAHATPGCNDPDVQSCVCDKLDTCCSDAWTAACTYIVTEKFCQPGVRDCVCGSGDGQWQQSTCCDADWSSTCDDVAQLKCGATVGCK